MAACSGTGGIATVVDERARSPRQATVFVERGILETRAEPMTGVLGDGELDAAAPSVTLSGQKGNTGRCEPFNRAPSVADDVASGRTEPPVSNHDLHWIANYPFDDARPDLVVEVIGPAVAHGLDGMGVPPGRQRAPAPPGVVRRARLPQTLAAPAGPPVRRVLRVGAERPSP